ncbi:hypothetical protein TgHK011_000826 [Trichoderma gracile]|nr:hypothetical protein TgHK011_000826 [Trichoderma gracile]
MLWMARSGVWLPCGRWPGLVPAPQQHSGEQRASSGASSSSLGVSPCKAVGWRLLGKILGTTGGAQDAGFGLLAGLLVPASQVRGRTLAEGGKTSAVDERQIARSGRGRSELLLERCRRRRRRRLVSAAKGGCGWGVGKQGASCEVRRRRREPSNLSVLSREPDDGEARGTVMERATGESHGQGNLLDDAMARRAAAAWAEANWRGAWVGSLEHAGPFDPYIARSIRLEARKGIQRQPGACRTDSE